MNHMARPMETAQIAKPVPATDTVTRKLRQDCVHTVYQQVGGRKGGGLAGAECGRATYIG